MSLCTICKKPIVLNPSAEERARRDPTGKSAAYYSSLFTTHSHCAIQKRTQQAIDTARRHRLNGGHTI